MTGSRTDGARPPEGLIGRPATREVVPLDPRFSTRWHRHGYPSPIARWNVHPEYEVHLITSGVGRFIVGDRIGRFGPGHLALVGPDLPHHWISDLAPGESLIDRDVVLQFTDRWVRSCIDLLPELTELDAMLRTATRGIEFTGDTARRGAELLEAIGSASGTDRVVATLGLLGALATAPEDEAHPLASDGVARQGDAASEDLVNHALDYIFANIHGAVSLSTAARLAGMSGSAFSRAFKRSSGHTFSDIVTRLRIAHAGKLLDGTGTPVATIAQEVGYRNLSNFNRRFLAETGLTPTQYRSRAR